MARNNKGVLDNNGFIAASDVITLQQLEDLWTHVRTARFNRGQAVNLRTLAWTSDWTGGDTFSEFLLCIFWHDHFREHLPTI